VSAGEALSNGQHVAINFHINQSGDPSGSIWLNVVDGKITQLNVILDSRFEWGEV